MSRSVLVLGGGIGGLVASNVLRKRLERNREVVLIDKKRTHEFPPSFPSVMLGRRPEETTRELASLNGKGIRYVNAEVSRIDVANRVIDTGIGDFSYDYLVVALGADLAPDKIPGLSDTAHHAYSLDGALKLKEALGQFAGGTIAIGASSLPFKCPTAPFEVALLLDNHFRKLRVRGKVNFKFFFPEPFPMPVAGPAMGKMLVQALEERGIAYHPSFKLASVNGKKRDILSENGEAIGFDLLFAVPPHAPPKVVRESELVGATGWIPVDKTKLTTRYDDVYAIGDVTSIKLYDGMMLPKAGVFAHKQAEVVAHNISAEVLGSGDMKEWDGKGQCFFETGDGKARMIEGDMYAEPRVVRPRRPQKSRIWHLARVLWEKYWFWRWF